MMIFQTALLNLSSKAFFNKKIMLKKDVYAREQSFRLLIIHTNI